MEEEHAEIVFFNVFRWQSICSLIDFGVVSVPSIFLLTVKNCLSAALPSSSPVLVGMVKVESMCQFLPSLIAGALTCLSGRYAVGRVWGWF